MRAMPRENLSLRSPVRLEIRCGYIAQNGYTLAVLRDVPSA